METDTDMIGRVGLEFFGRMCASISHDIKNVLAVVNENAGLLEDLCAMADRGKPIDLSRLKRLAADVKAQVRRGDGIVYGMNRFAHSVDSSVVRLDLVEVMELLKTLSLRFASMQGTAFHLLPPQDAATVTTAPFLLLNLLWLCLEQAMAAAGPGRTVELTAEKEAGGAHLRFRRLEVLGSAAADAFPTETAGRLCRALNAEVRVDVQAKEILVKIFDLQA
jgi:K+-sensing histidine kinase KdpD